MNEKMCNEAYQKFGGHIKYIGSRFPEVDKINSDLLLCFPFCPTVNCSLHSPNIINHMRCLNLYRSRFQRIIASVNL